MPENQSNPNGDQSKCEVTEPWVLEATIAVREYISSITGIELSAEDGLEIAARIENASEYDLDEPSDWATGPLHATPGQFGEKEFVPTETDPLMDLRREIVLTRIMLTERVERIETAEEFNAAAGDLEKLFCTLEQLVKSALMAERKLKSKRFDEPMC